MVHGRLLDAATGEPLVGVEVGALHSAGQTEADVLQRKAWKAESDARERAYNQAHGIPTTGDEPGTRHPGFGSIYPSTTTDENGRFRLDLAVPCSGSTSVLGLVTYRSGDGPREGLEALRIEGPGMAPVRVPVPAGAWKRRQGAYDDEKPYAVWMLGDIRLDPGAR